MPKKKKDEKFFDLATSFGIIAALVFAVVIYQYPASPDQGGSSNPPSFAITQSKLLGNLDANNCIPLGQTFTQDDADGFSDPDGTKNAMSEGLNFYHHERYDDIASGNPTTVKDIMDSVVPVAGNRVFFIHYSNGFDELDPGFHIYPALPEGTDTSASTEEIHNVDDPDSTIIAPGIGFGLYSCKDTEIWNIKNETQSQILTFTDSDSNEDYRTAQTLELFPDGWVNIAVNDEVTLGEYFACSGEHIESIWVQKEDGFNGFSSDLSYSNINDADLEAGHYMVWIKVGDNQDFEAVECNGDGTVKTNEDLIEELEEEIEDLYSQLDKLDPESDQDEIASLNEQIEDKIEEWEELTGEEYVNEADSDLAQIPTCSGQQATIYIDGTNLIKDGQNLGAYTGSITATEQADIIVGTEATDNIDGLGGDDFICSLGGDDEVNGGDGQDVIYGGNGNDQLDGGESSDIIFAGEGNDTILGQASDDALFGEGGNDKIYGHDGKDYVCGGTGDDTVEGGSDDDHIDTESGADSADGGSGTDICNAAEESVCEREDIQIAFCDTSLDFYQEIDEANDVFQGILGKVMDACPDQNYCETAMTCTGPCDDSDIPGCFTCPNVDRASTSADDEINRNDIFGDSADANTDKVKNQCPDNYPFASEKDCKLSCSSNICITNILGQCYGCLEGSAKIEFGADETKEKVILK